MNRVFGAIETFIRDSNQRVALFAVLRICGDTVVHGYRDGKIERAQNFGECDTDATAQRGSLCRVRLREEKSEFIAADSKCGVGGTKGFSQGGGGGLQDFVAAWMAMLVVDFLEAVKIEDYQA